MRWLLLDEVIEIKKSAEARTRSTVPDAEFSPEVLILEMMAQTGGLLVGAETDYRNDVIFAKIESAEFLTDWNPGEPIRITAVSPDVRPEGGWIDARVETMRGLAAHSRFLLMSVDKLVAGTHASITFHENFMNYFRVREKVK